MVLPYFHYSLAVVDRHILLNAEDASVRSVECCIFHLSVRVERFEILCPIYGIASDGRVVAIDFGNLD